MELKLHSPVGAEPVVYSWPLSGGKVYKSVFHIFQNFVVKFLKNFRNYNFLRFELFGYLKNDLCIFILTWLISCRIVMMEQWRSLKRSGKINFFFFQS